MTGGSEICLFTPFEDRVMSCVFTVHQWLTRFRMSTCVRNLLRNELFMLLGYEDNNRC